MRHEGGTGGQGDRGKDRGTSESPHNKGNSKELGYVAVCCGILGENVKGNTSRSGFNKMYS